MLVDLDTPYADTTAADLSLSLDGPVRPALHVLTVEVAGVAVRLRLLGASHQVRIDASGAAWSETVACLPGSPALPREVASRDGAYHFASRVFRLDRADLAERVGALRRDLADDPAALVGVFPGDSDAVTALRVRPAPAPGVIGWETWHAYPQTGELVRTESRVNLP